MTSKTFQTNLGQFWASAQYPSQLATLRALVFLSKTFNSIQGIGAVSFDMDLKLQNILDEAWKAGGKIKNEPAIEVFEDDAGEPCISWNEDDGMGSRVMLANFCIKKGVRPFATTNFALNESRRAESIASYLGKLHDQYGLIIHLGSLQQVFRILDLLSQ